MFKDSIVLAVICLIVVGGIFAWWMKVPAESASAVVAPQVQEPEPPAKPAPKAVRVASIPKPDPAPVVEPAPVVIAAPVVPPAPVVRPDPPPFPVVEQIATGSHESSITGKYGDPALSAVTSTGGHMVETFVYARNRGRLATVIRLEDGKVAAAYSRSEPTLPAGLSAPRRWHNE